MKNIRTIVEALSSGDIKSIHQLFYRDTDKIAELFKMLAEGKSDEEIKTTLGLTNNAYATLRSRLRVKVQDYLISYSDSPKADVLNKLLSINDILFTEKPTIALITLKKLERELIKYDLSGELITVYQYLKKLHINSEEYFHYSQLYNRNVAYSLALDKAEDILAKYFKEYGYFFAMGDKSKRLELTAHFEEMKNVCALYTSHRMFVYFAALQIFHRLYVDEKAAETYNLEPIEDILEKVDETFGKYVHDSIYHHLKLLFTYIRFEYYFKHGILVKAKIILAEIDNNLPALLVHYENFCFPAQILLRKLELRHFQNAQEQEHWDQDVFHNFIISSSDPGKVVYLIYRALNCFRANNYSAASKWLFKLNNEIKFKAYHNLQLEVKCLISYVKFMQKDNTLFKQNLTSAQRILRLLGADANEHLNEFVRLLGVLNSESKNNKLHKLQQRILSLNRYQLTGLHPTLYLNLDAAQLFTRLA